MRDTLHDIRETLNNHDIALGDKLKDLGLDSLDFHELEIMAQDDYQAEISVDEFAEMTIGELIDHVKLRKGTRLTWWQWMMSKII